ncbi:unnamed protein product [Penicillium salamii]|uniref:Zn(2)-C6 fungal-type domain-containing protein n=1 Tax=Penicillium salamii TaxID=1612424 RepID=A0A9W4JJM5_9EURO|nr:unnamed protein product [Penicillium salamii]CAG8397937.1 unnamed protein product [Penicillium salamii]CAG8403502.1 unnamed protein product [Penicillium salamii]CAG8418060.1 unnamed protein product [Penicillium salamii]
MKVSHHHNPKHFPALAPGPPRMFAPQTSTAVTKPKKNSTACLACKAAKRKCSGPDAPCKACRAANTECYFDPSRDLRRKVAVKRTIQELTNHKELLASLIKTLKRADEPELENILNLIRKEAPLEDIAEVVGGPATTFADPQELSTASKLAISEYGDQPVEISGSASQPRRTSDASNVASSPEDTQFMKAPQLPVVSPYERISLESLCDIPLFEVPASPWTCVTDSDYLVSHLVSLYFTWDHSGSQFLDQRVFLAHMRHADLDSSFCTPLLVNSLLAIASTHSDKLDVLSSPDDAYSRGQPFFDEAQRLWEAEAEAEASLSPTNLCNVQALLMMCCFLKLQGRASKSWLVLGQAVLLAQGMGLFDSPMPTQATTTSEMERVRIMTAWGIFNLRSQLSVELKITAPLACPKSDNMLCGNDDFDWIPYPRSYRTTYDTKSARLPDIRQGMVDISKILSDAQGLLCQGNRGASPEDLWREVQAYFNRLDTWLQRWPSVSEMEVDPVPQFFIVRIKCLEAIISLFEIVNGPAEPRLTQEVQYYQTRSAYEMAECLRAHRRAYSLKHIPSQMGSAVQIGLRVLARHSDDSDESRQAFAELCRFGMSLSYKHKETAKVMKDIRVKGLQHNLRLPHEIVEIPEGKGYGYES